MWCLARKITSVFFFAESTGVHAMDADQKKNRLLANHLFAHQQIEQ